MTDKTLPGSHTTPAQTVRHARPGSVRDQPLSVLMLLAGIWLFVCMWPLEYPEEYNTRPHLVETGASVILIITALSRLSHPRGRLSDLLVTATGAGLILAAFLDGYGDTAATRVMRVNDVVSGSVLVVLGLVSSILLTSAQAADRAHEDGRPH
ncbi:SPW repeat domain-containing protein [Streptomyces sp. 7R007]